MDATSLVQRIRPVTTWTAAAYGSGLEELSPTILEKLPATYLEFVSALAGGEGFIATSFLRLYGLAECAGANRQYHIEKFLPGCWLFGSDGCGNAFLFDLEPSPPEILQAPFIPLDRRYAKAMGSDFAAFIEVLALTPPTFSGSLPIQPNPETAGKEIHEIHPIVLGGDPTLPENKTLLSPPEHAQAATFFNRLIQRIEREGASRGI